ncbi:MAG TPA: hypothetical protein DFH96_07595, partial [Bacteroidetes bacterium]|nr:hypothetical protein [Bacteroidota bacterium]
MSAMLWTTGAQAQATLPYTENFASNTFTFVNGTQTNKWAYGSAAGNVANAIYVSNDGGTTNAYTITSLSVVHAYRDIIIPSGATLAQFSFQWKANGESSYDYLRVWLVPTSFTPTAGTQTTAGSGRIQVGANFNQQTTWQTYQNSALNVSTFAGQTMRLVFEWRNDGSGGSQPPAAVDNISLSIPSCQSPTAPLGSPTTATTANISWTAASPIPSNGYEYAVTTSAVPPPSGTAFAGTSTSVTGLTANTTYYLHVRSYCGGSDYSAWVTSATFTTPCVAINTFPYTE